MPKNNVVMVIKLTFLGDNARILVPSCHGHIIVSFHSHSNCMDKLPILESLRGIFFSGLKTLSAEATLEQVKSVSFILIILT